MQLFAAIKEGERIVNCRASHRDARGWFGLLFTLPVYLMASLTGHGGLIGRTWRLRLRASMITLNSLDINALIASYLWPFTRIMGLLSIAPLFGNNGIPARLKVALGMLLSAIVAPTASVNSSRYARPT